MKKEEKEKKEERGEKEKKEERDEKEKKEDTGECFLTGTRMQRQVHLPSCPTPLAHPMQYNAEYNYNCTFVQLCKMEYCKAIMK